ncbi:MAG: hypothetical protein DCF22_00590 [Leptolyngbya sp.]|nr:MAG: hypothetical protein DCF22_00590 [Leptolyngbya sp.]
MKAKVKDFNPDKRNANKGTDRGRELLRASLEKLGAGRSILVDKNGSVIAGNKTREAAIALGLEDAIVVETDGSQLVVVKRTDLNLEVDAAAKELAIADNRASELGLEYDLDILSELSTEIDLSQFWEPDELDDMLSVGRLIDPEDADRAEAESKLGKKASTVKAVLYADSAATFEQALRMTGNVNRGNALLEICEFYLAHATEGTEG